MDAGLLQQRVQPGRVRALGQPQSARPALPEACPVGLDPRAELEAHAGLGGQQRQHGVGGCRRPGGEGRQSAEQIAAQGLQHVGGVGVLPGGALQLGGHRRVFRGLDVQRVGGGTHLAQEGQAALYRTRRLELVAQDRCEREGHRCAGAQHVEQREVGGGHGLPQPLLAEGPGPEALHVGHVGVQDEGGPPGCEAAVGIHARQTATKSSARSRPSSRRAKSRTSMAGVNRS